MYYELISNNLKARKSAAAAGAYLASVTDKVKEWKAPNAADSTAAAPVEVEKVLIQNQKVSSEGYVPGFGFGSAELDKVLNGQKVGEWGPVIETLQGAVMVRVNGKTDPEASALESTVKQEVENANRYTSMTLFNQFVNDLEKGTPVESNLDLFYKD